VINLGLACTANGGSLVLLAELGTWGQGSFAQQLQVAYRDFKSWAKARKIRTSQPPFKPGHATQQQAFLSPDLSCVRFLRSLARTQTIASEVVKKKHGIYWNTKGFNARVLTAWLQEGLSTAYLSGAHPNAALLAPTLSAMPLGLA
jgi:hypothetical protein